MTPLQILGFQKMCGLSSHLGGVFGVSMTFGRQFDVIFGNFVPLSHRKLGRLTFLQGSHKYKVTRVDEGGFLAFL
jgi:hypothetical protein